MEKRERASRFALFVFLVSRGCCVTWVCLQFVMTILTFFLDFSIAESRAKIRPVKSIDLDKKN